MSLLGWPLLVLLGLLMVALPVTTLVLWPRVRGPRLLRSGVRLSLVGASQVTAVLFVAAALNDYGYFYGSWSDLFGRSSPVGQPSAAAPGHRADGRRQGQCRGCRYAEQRPGRPQPARSGSCRTPGWSSGPSGPAGAGWSR